MPLADPQTQLKHLTKLVIYLFLNLRKDIFPKLERIFSITNSNIYLFIHFLLSQIAVCMLKELLLTNLSPKYLHFIKDLFNSFLSIFSYKIYCYISYSVCHSNSSYRRHVYLHQKGKRFNHASNL